MADQDDPLFLELQSLGDDARPEPDPVEVSPTVRALQEDGWFDRLAIEQQIANPSGAGECRRFDAIANMTISVACPD